MIWSFDALHSPGGPVSRAAHSNSDRCSGFLTKGQWASGCCRKSNFVAARAILAEVGGDLKPSLSHYISKFITAMWARVEHILPGKATDPGAAAADSRRLLEAVLRRSRTGSPWRDLPERFGNWNSVFKRFRRWAVASVFERIFNALSDEFDLEHVFVDGTVVQAHQKAAGAKGGPAARGSAVPGAAWPARSWPSWTRSGSLRGSRSFPAGRAGPSGGPSERSPDR